VTDHSNGNKIEYEQTDADLSAVTKAGLGIAVVAVLVALALVPILGVMVGRQAKSDAAPPPIAGFEPGRQAPEPRLQGEPFGDWTALKAKQESLLGSYGWVDEPGGVTRIPIDQAMKMLVERGLPARAPVGATPSAPPPGSPAGPAPGVASPAAPVAPGHTTGVHP
jgi:hypothetical protein